MAHNRQLKDVDQSLWRVIRWDYPKKGDLYWNRHRHKVEEALEDLEEKFLLVKATDDTDIGVRGS